MFPIMIILGIIFDQDKFSLRKKIGKLTFFDGNRVIGKYYIYVNYGNSCFLLRSSSNTHEKGLLT